MKITLSLSDYAQRTASEIAALPKFSAAVAEKAYKLSDTVVIDNVAGMGATPNNQNVLYMGFVALLKLSDFAKLAYAGDSAESAVKILQRMKLGEAIASPSMYIDIKPFIDDDLEPYGHAFIDGHEGRARCLAMIASGLTEAPVQFFIRTYRARHVKDDAKRFQDWLNSGVVSEDGKHMHTNVFKHLTFG